MKRVAGAGVVAIIFLIVAVRAEGEGAVPRANAVPAKQRPDWGEWTRPLQPRPARTEQARSEALAPAAQAAATDEIDVVDAHWMALTMWGEARSGGEAAMRAVGHVIDNRHRAGRGGGYVTDTVSEAWQFSAWNEGDPNRAAMLNIDALRPGSGDHRMWLGAKRLAAEILAGRSTDPTGGALFYHTADVSPRWSAGVPPTRVVGGHLFFRAAR